MGTTARIKALFSNDIRLLITQPSEEADSELARGGYARVELRGNFENLDFLLPHKARINALDLVGGRFASMHGLGDLSDLQSLSTSVGLDANATLSKLSKLVRLNFNGWRRRFEPQVLDCARLQHLRIEGYDRTDCSAFAVLNDLRSVCFARGALQSLHGLRACTGMTSVDLSHLRRFSDLSELALLPCLADLEIFEALPGVRDIESIKTIYGMKRLILTGFHHVHTTLKWLAPLRQLRVLALRGIVEPDWKNLFASRYLKKVSFNFNSPPGLSLDAVCAIAEQEGHKPTGIFPSGNPRDPSGYVIEFRPPGSEQNLWFWDDDKESKV